MSANSTFIAKELSWLGEVMITRLKLYFKQPTDYNSIGEIEPQEAFGNSGNYENFIKESRLTIVDRICLILSLAPLLRPQIFDCFGIKNSDTGQRFVEFGCFYEKHSHVTVPTVETLLFILAGSDIEQRLHYICYFDSHFLFSQKMILKENISEGEWFFNSRLTPSPYMVANLIREREYQPEFSTRFPARRLTTLQEWSDLVLPPETLEQVNEIRLWAEHGNRMLAEWELSRKMRPGYKALFYGPPGTGKTLTASLLGKYTGKEVYCIDLSMVVSKYIGETEKNLSHIFDVAENRDWILFFDEGDALFGKRTQVKDAHDRYANQEVSYLLQRLEDYRGLVVLSTNFRSNIDEAFTRRFHSIIRFAIPDPEHREVLWKNTFSHKTELAPDIDLKETARRFELPGGSILNIVRYCSLMAIQQDTNIISYSNLENGIRKELLKEGKILN